MIFTLDLEFFEICIHRHKGVNGIFQLSSPLISIPLKIKPNDEIPVDVFVSRDIRSNP